MPNPCPIIGPNDVQCTTLAIISISLVFTFFLDKPTEWINLHLACAESNFPLLPLEPGVQTVSSAIQILETIHQRSIKCQICIYCTPNLTSPSLLHFSRLLSFISTSVHTHSGYTHTWGYPSESSVPRHATFLHFVHTVQTTDTLSRFSGLICFRSPKGIMRIEI
ncbi:hypothetical protein BJX70DRAFT_252004 [Aspergillus crustosus]